MQAIRTIGSKIEPIGEMYAELRTLCFVAGLERPGPIDCG